jgi:hypothetical protein
VALMTLQSAITLVAVPLDLTSVFRPSWKLPKLIVMIIQVTAGWDPGGSKIAVTYVLIDCSNSDRTRDARLW